MRQRTLGILAGVLMVSGAGLGAGSVAFAIGTQGTVTTFPGPDGQGDRPQLVNPGPLGPGVRRPGPGLGMPGSGQTGPRFGRPGDRRAPWDQPLPGGAAPQQ